MGADHEMVNIYVPCDYCDRKFPCVECVLATLTTKFVLTNEFIFLVVFMLFVPQKYQFF